MPPSYARVQAEGPQGVQARMPRGRVLQDCGREPDVPVQRQSQTLSIQSGIDSLAREQSQSLIEGETHPLPLHQGDGSTQAQMIAPTPQRIVGLGVTARHDSPFEAGAVAPPLLPPASDPSLGADVSRSDTVRRPSPAREVSSPLLSPFSSERRSTRASIEDAGEAAAAAEFLDAAFGPSEVSSFRSFSPSSDGDDGERDSAAIEQDAGAVEGSTGSSWDVVSHGSPETTCGACIIPRSPSPCPSFATGHSYLSGEAHAGSSDGRSLGKDPESPPSAEPVVYWCPPSRSTSPFSDPAPATGPLPAPGYRFVRYSYGNRVVVEQVQDEQQQQQAHFAQAVPVDLFEQQSSSPSGQDDLLTARAALALRDEHNIPPAIAHGLVARLDMLGRELRLSSYTGDPEIETRAADRVRRASVEFRGMIEDFVARRDTMMAGQMEPLVERKEIEVECTPRQRDVETVVE